MSEKKQMTPEAKRNLLIVIGVMVVAAAITVWMLFSVADKQVVQRDKVQVATIAGSEDEKDIGVKDLSSDTLADLNRQADEQDAAAAQQNSGGVYIPRKVSGEREHIPTPQELKAIAKEEARVAEEKRQEEVAIKEAEIARIQEAAAAQEHLERSQNLKMRGSVESVAAKIEALQTMSADSKPRESVTGVLTRFPPKGPTPEQLKKIEDAKKFICPIGETCNAEGKVLIALAGSRAFVQLEMSINTDEVSPIFGRIIAGNSYMKGRTIFGAFTHNPNMSVSMTFSRVSLVDGTIAVNAIAIDSKTGRAAVTGKVDHKYFERFGLPMIAGATGKYAELTALSGSTVSAGLGSTTQTSTLKNEQIQNAAIAEGLKLGTAALSAQAAAAVPSTTLPNNVGIEIRFLDDVWL